MTARPIARRERFVAYATGGFGMALNAMVAFLLPLRAVELGIGVATIGLLLGAKGLTEAVASVPVGSLIDRVGTRRAFVLGTGASALLGLAYAVAPGWPALLALQMLLGVVRPLGWVGSQSLVSGLRGGAERATDTGRFGFVASAAQIVAPLLVGLAAQRLGTSGGFLAMAGYCGVFAVTGILAPDIETVGDGANPNETTSRRPPPRGRGFAQAVGILRLPPIRVAMLLTFTRLWVPSAWVAFFPLYLVTSGSSKAAAATTVSVMALTATVIAAFVGRIAKLGSDVTVTAVALAAGCAGLAVAPFVGDVPTAYVSSVLVGVGQGVSLPMLIVLVSDAAPDGMRATALGLRASINQLAAAAAPVIVAAVLGFAAATVGFPVAGGIGGGVLLAAIATDRRARPAGARRG